MSRTGQTYDWIEVAGIPYLRLSGVARRLGAGTSQVDNWNRRRERNGFPEALIVHRPGLRPLPVWDPDEVDAWWATYRPGRGGAPAGERNGSWRDGARRRIDEYGTRRRAS